MPNIGDASYDRPRPKLPKASDVKKEGKYQWLTDALDTAQSRIEIPLQIHPRESREKVMANIRSAAWRESLRRGCRLSVNFFAAHKRNRKKLLLVVEKVAPTDSELDGRIEDPIADDVNPAIDTVEVAKLTMPEPMETPEEAGAAAATVFMGLDSNPYDSGTPEAKKWVEGHQRASSALE